MAYVLIRHKVADFEKWKPVYEDHRPAREAAGIEVRYLWRNMDDPSEVIVLFEASDLGKVKAFLGSAELKEKMQAAGVLGPPEFVFLSEG